MRSRDPAHLEALAFVGAWRGKQVGEGQKSLTLRLRFRRPDATLRREEVDAIMAELTGALHTALGAELRT